MKCFADIIKAWPSAAEMAADCGVSEHTPKQWRTRDSIPPEYWLLLCQKAVERGIEGVSPALLTRLAAKRGRHDAA